MERVGRYTKTLAFQTVSSILLSMELSLMSSSSSFSIAPQKKYEVFLSFRGEDTRNNFTSHLHKALSDKQIETFIDNELRRGDDISPSLLKVIEESQISIIVFSKDYASSRWCLEELVKIIECKNKYGQIVIPVFYNIDPSYVRNQMGSFVEALVKREVRFKEKLSCWRAALIEAANLCGWNSLVTKPESVLIQDIVEDVLKRLNDVSSSSYNDLIGINSRVKKIESLLYLESKDVRSVGLWGIGGVGKTTLAGVVFDKISCQFEGSYFIQNVREESEQIGGLNRLRRELISTILGDGNLNISTSFIGPAITKKRLARKRLLLVFDDVTDFRQIESLIGGLNCLGSGSRIIITTRNKQVLKNCRVDHIYKVEELCYDDSLKLFCQYAFGFKCPTVDYEKLSNRLVSYVGGVPLALKVLGSSLFDKKKEVWESAINKLEKFLDKDIHKVLKISYDELDDDQRNIFLDIACFLKGMEVNLVRMLMDANGFFTEVGISTLIDKSLITISNNMLRMHDLLQAMGKEIVRQESVDDPGKRSRLWHHEDIYHVLKENTGTKAIVGISLDMSKITDVHLRPRAFVKMKKLRFLEFYNSQCGENDNKVHIFQGLEPIFTELRYLRWNGCPSKSLQSNIHPQNLVVLDMPRGNVEQLWNGVQKLVNLYKMNLSYSKHLTSCPDFLGTPNLERLILAGCTSLFEIPSSIRYLNKLDFLDLRNCKSLTGLPDCTGLKALRWLFLSSCSKLKTLPGLPNNIEKLNLDDTAIEEFPSSTNHLCRLLELDLENCSRLKSLPSSIFKWKSLGHLRLSGCSRLAKLPDDIATLESLRYLDAARTTMCLDNLYNPSFERCKVQDMSGLLLHNLMYLDLTDCGITMIADSLGHLSSLRELYLGKNSFESIPASIKNLSKLEYIDISYCERLQFLPELPLISIDAYNCTSLQVLSCFSTLDTTFVSGSGIINDVCFINCFKLDQNILQVIVKDALQKIQRVQHSFSNQDGYSGLPNVCMCFPGSEVPEDFSFRSTGSYLTVELSPGWFNDNFIGFALWAVVAFRDHQFDGWDLGIRCECKIKCKDGKWRNTLFGCWAECARVKERCIESDHVYMRFDPCMAPADIAELCCTNVVSFQLYFWDINGESSRECCKVKKCGVRLMYAREIGASTRSFSSYEDQEDEPYPKKLKLIDSL